MDGLFDVACEAMSVYPVIEKEEKKPDRRIKSSSVIKIVSRIAGQLDSIPVDTWVKYSKKSNRIVIKGFSAVMEHGLKVILEKRTVHAKDRVRKSDFDKLGDISTYHLEIRRGKCL